ncbi:uncharacterized protein LOC134212998 isoform X2 [Armigeres subalbatus]
MSDEEDEYFCYICAKPETNVTRLIECVQCNKYAHFRCKKLFGNAVTRAKSKPFFCSVDCSQMSSHNIRQTTTNDDIIHELQVLGNAVKGVKHDSEKFRLLFEDTRMQIADIVSTSKQIEKSQVFLTHQFDQLTADFKSFKEEVGSVKAENSKIRKELKMWQDTCGDLVGSVDRLEVDMDNINRSAKAKNAVILGLPAMQDEDTVELVCMLCKLLNCEFVGTSVIQCARRINGKQHMNGVPPIVVQFTSEREKEELFRRKRAYGVVLASKVRDVFNGSTHTITIRDEMTAYGRDLLQQAKNLQETLKIKYVWPGRDGKILLRRQDGGKIEQISSKLQLAGLQPTNSKRVLNLSGISPPNVPQSKRM